eukprot:4816068-Lingulodinium_polyedra.AAC.1
MTHGLFVYMFMRERTINARNYGIYSEHVSTSSESARLRAQQLRVVRHAMNVTRATSAIARDGCNASFGGS